MYFKKMTGTNCYLSPIDVDDAPRFTEWLNDMEITEYLTLAPFVISLGSEREALQRISKEHNYSIIDRATNTLIGNCGLDSIDSINRTANVGIFVGDRAYLGKGYGTEALRLLIDYAFTYLNLENIMLCVYSFNARAIKCYEKTGFKTIGLRRNALQRKGKFHDIVFMDIIPADFYVAGKPVK